MHRIVLSCICLAIGDPPVEGDLKLVQVLLDAQQANLAHFTQGELRATTRTLQNGSSEATLNVHLIWSADKAFWEFDFNTRYRKQSVASKRVIPVYGRMLYDGREYTKYIPGEVQVFSQADYHNIVPDYPNMDLRPSMRWIRPDPSASRTWAELLGPHPKFPSDEIERWVIRQDGSNVIINRHDRYADGTTGLSETVASLDLAGNVLERTYRGRGQVRQYKFEWDKDTAGRVALRKESWREQLERGAVLEHELVIASLKTDIFIAPDQFSLAPLQIRRGTKVDDRIRNRRYTFTGKVVDQEILDSLSEEAQDAARSKRPPE